MEALIVGAGIGGLTAALSLHAGGIEPRIIEAAAEIRPLGVGINLTGRSMVVAGNNTNAKFVAYPVSRRHEMRGRSLMNWVAEIRGRGGGVPVADWSREGRLEDVLPGFRGWRFFGVDPCDLMSGTRRILEYPMVDRDPLPFWGTGRVTLLGDAAHPMYPIGSNGGSQAVIDARVLALELARTADPAEGLAAYQAERLPKANAVALANRSIPMDRVLNLVAERAPDGFADIADVLTAGELAELAQAFRLTTGADAAALNSRASFAPPRSDLPGV